MHLVLCLPAAVKLKSSLNEIGLLDAFANSGYARDYLSTGVCGLSIFTYLHKTSHLIIKETVPVKTKQTNKKQKSLASVRGCFVLPSFHLFQEQNRRLPVGY